MRALLTAVVRRPIGVALAIVALSALGALSLYRLPLSAMPRVERPVIRAAAAFPGYSMERLEADVAPEIESRLIGLPGADGVTVWCADAVAACEITFRWGTDAARARLKVREALEGFEGFATSSGAAGFDVAGVDPLDRPALVIAIDGPAPLDRRTAFADDIVRPELSGLPDVGRVEILGGERIRTVVRPDPRKMAARGVTANAVRGALRAGTLNRPVGEVTLQGNRIDVVLEGAGEDAARVAALRVPAGPSFASAALSEVASVRVEPWGDHGAFLVRGAPTVGVAVHLAAGANAIAAGRRLDRALASLSLKLPEGARITRVADDAAELRRALQGLAAAGALGALMSGLVLAAFTRRLAPLALLVPIVPLSLLASFPVFEALGLDLNLVSIAGIAMVMGMLVDAGIVVLGAWEQRAGAERAVGAVLDVGRAVIASAVTTAVVFVPALYLRHLAAALFRPLAIAIMITLMASLVFSLVALPVGIARLPAAARAREDALSRRYRRALAPLMARPWWSIVVLAGSLALTALLAAKLPQRLLPPEAQTAADVELALSPTLAPGDIGVETERLGPVLQAIRKIDEGDLLVVGRPPRSGPPLPRAWWRLAGPRSVAEIRQLGDDLRVAFPSLGVIRAAPTGGILDALPLRPLAVEIKGPDRARVLAAADRVVSALRRDGLDVIPDALPMRSALRLDLTPLGLRQGAAIEQAVADALRAPEPLSLGGVRVDERALEVADLEGRGVPTGPAATGTSAAPSGAGASGGPPATGAAGAAGASRASAPLGSLARFERFPRPPVLVRHGGEPAVELILGHATGEVRGIEARLASPSISLPAGVRLASSGGLLDWRDARSELGLALALGFLLVFLVLTAMYESIRLALAVFATVPFACLGGVLGLRLAGQGLDMSSGLGFVLLGGLAVNNAVLLLDRLAGCPGGVARWGLKASRRLRPVLITTLTTLATLGPVAFMGGAGASVRATLALVVFWGLLLSTLAALFVLPALGRVILPKAKPAEAMRARERTGARP